MSVPKIAAALSLVGALSLGSDGPAQSAPLTGLSAAARPDAQQSDAVQVRFGGWGGGWCGGGWGGGWRGRGWGWGLAAGAVVGAAIASPYYYGGYYPYSGYGYGYPSYGYPDYGYAAEYYPAYSYGYYRPYGVATPILTDSERLPTGRQPRLGRTLHHVLRNLAHLEAEAKRQIEVELEEAKTGYWRMKPFLEKIVGVSRWARG
jgi:hypothetical protein